MGTMPEVTRGGGGGLLKKKLNILNWLIEIVDCVIFVLKK